MLTNARKFLVSLAAAVGVLVSMGLLTGAVQLWVIGAISAVNAGLVYWIPNQRAMPRPAVDDAGAFDALMQQNEAHHFITSHPSSWPAEVASGTGSHAEPDTSTATVTGPG